MGQFTQNGVVYEELPNGQVRVVGYAPMAGATPIGGPDPKLPLEVQGAQLGNANAGVNVRVNQATENAQIREANAKATKAEIEARAAGATNVNPGAKAEEDLRTQFEGLPEVRGYKESAAALGGMLRAPDTSGGDINVIYAFIRAQGPGPVAEGELKLAQGAASLQEDLERKYGKITSANRLPKRVRTELIESARQSVAGKGEIYAQSYKRFRDLASQNGVDPERVTGPYVGDAIRPLEEKYIRQHGGTPRSANDQPSPDAPGINLDANGNVILQDRGGGTIESDTGIIGEKGGYHTEPRPGFEGANAALNAMLKSGASNLDIANYFKGKGASPEQVQDILNQVGGVRQFQQKNLGYRGDFNVDIERVQVPNSLYQNVINSDVGTGLTLGANALAAGVPGAIAGEQPEIDIARDAHPKSAFAGEAAGAIGGILTPNKALRAVANPLRRAESPIASAAGRFLVENPKTRLALADAAYGATYGATQNPDQPVKGGLFGAGAALGGNAIGSSLGGMAVRGGGRLLGYNPAPALAPSEGMIASQALKADPSAVMGRLQQADEMGMPFAPADAAPQLRALLGSATRKSPNAYALANENLGNRTLGQVDRLTGLVEGELGPRLNLPTFKEGVKKSAQAKSKPLYDSAKSQGPVDDPQLNEMLQTPAGQRAVRSGYDEALNNGEPVGDLVQEVDSITGQPRLVGRPSWHVLQRAKFALDEMPDQTNLALRFNSRLGKLNPDFRKANLEYSKEMRRGDIAEAGYGAANPNIRAPQLDSSMAAPRNMKDPALFKQGYGSNLIDKAMGMRDSANPYEVASMASPDQLLKMQAVSPGLANKFGRARGLEQDMSLTNREVFGGSPTASRMEADKLFEGNGLANDAAELALSVGSGTPPINLMRSKLFAGRFGVNALKDRWQFGFGKSAQHKADQMTPFLSNPNPGEAADALAEMLRQQAARDEYVRRTGMFGASIGAPVGIAWSNQ